MTTETRNAIIALAREEAADWFAARLEAWMPELLPGEAWASLNERYPDNAIATENGPTEIDLLFETAFMQDMARRWLAETTAGGDEQVTTETQQALATIQAATKTIDQHVDKCVNTHHCRVNEEFINEQTAKIRNMLTVLMAEEESNGTD